MTHTPPPLTDEDLSAYLDGEVTPEVRARIEGDQNAQQRVRSLATARDTVRSAPVTPLPADVVDSMISRAIEAGDPIDSAAPVAPALPLKRGGRSRSQSTTWMVAAAVVALVAIGLGMVWSGVQSTETADTAGSGEPSTEAEQQAARQGEADAADMEDSAFEGATPTSSDAADLLDLGSVSTAAELRRSLSEGLPADADLLVQDDADPITVGQVDSCTQQVGVRHGTGSEVVGVGTATVADQRYLVYDLKLAEPEEAGDHLVAVVEIGHGCPPFITFYR